MTCVWCSSCLIIDILFYFRIFSSALRHPSLVLSLITWPFQIRTHLSPLHPSPPLFLPTSLHSSILPICLSSSLPPSLSPDTLHPYRSPLPSLIWLWFLSFSSNLNFLLSFLILSFAFWAIPNTITLITIIHFYYIACDVWMVAAKEDLGSLDSMSDRAQVKS